MASALLAYSSSLGAQEQPKPFQWHLYLKCNGFLSEKTTLSSGRTEDTSGQKTFNFMVYNLDAENFVVQTQGLQDNISASTVDEELRMVLSKTVNYQSYKISTLRLLYINPAKFKQGEKADGSERVDVLLDRMNGTLNIKMDRGIPNIFQVNMYGNFNCVPADQNTRKF